MRPLLLLILISFCSSGFSQHTERPGFISETGRSANGLVKLSLLVDQNGYGKELLIYKKGKNWDTLSIARDGDSDMGDTCFLQTVQIDQKGLQEVVLSWTGGGSHSYGGPTGGGFVNKFTKHEIWNLDTGKKLFEAQSMYCNEESVGINSETDPSILRTRTETCSYWYTFSVTPTGKIMIRDYKEKNSVTYDDETVNRIKEEKNACSFPMPDHKPGVYVFRGGKFVREKL